MKKASVSVLGVSLAAVLLLFACAGGQGQYKNGVYKASYNAFDGHGWKPELTVTIKGGKVDKVDFNYVSPQGTLKTNDKGYETAMKKVTGTGPVEYTAKLAKELVAKQAAGVDTVTGATEASSEFNAMADAVLAQAKTGNTKPVTLQMNATYKASVKKFDSHGWKGQIAVTYKDGKISAVNYDEVNKDKVLKTKDAAYAKAMNAKAHMTPAKAYSTLEKELVSTQDPGKVDVVTGATEGSHTFIELAKQAIAQRSGK